MVKAVSFSLANRLILVVILLAYSGTLAAQRRGSSSGGAGLSTYGRPDGVDEKDSLKDFHHILAVQATSQQIAELSGTREAHGKREDSAANLSTKRRATDLCGRRSCVSSNGGICPGRKQEVSERTLRPTKIRTPRFHQAHRQSRLRPRAGRIEADADHQRRPHPARRSPLAAKA